MSTQETKNEPVIVLDDQKYLINDLSDEAKVIVSVLQNVTVQLQEHNMKGMTLQAASESLTNKLKVLLEDSASEDVPGEDTPVM